MEIDKTLRYKTGIYLLKINNHSYVGSSKNLLNRIRRHYTDLRRGVHDNQYLQRTVDKYGIENLTYSILEFLPSDIEIIELLKREKYFIDFLHSDLNLKLDPVTQQGCVTTCKKVYQFNQFGELIKEWTSETEAADFYQIHSSNIIKACKNPERQRIAAGFLWSYEKIYPYKLKVIYIFDLNGKFLSRHQNTVEVYETYFPNDPRKRVLSQLKKKIDYPVPYKYIYLSSTLDFKITKKEKNVDEYTLSELLRKQNPLINIYTDKGDLRSSKHFLDITNKTNIRKKIENKYTFKEVKNLSIIDLEIDNSKKNSKVVVKSLTTKEEKSYGSITKAIIALFGKYDDSLYKNTVKHIIRGTPYKGYLFIRDL